MASRRMQPKRCCFSPPIRRVSLPASFSPSTAALWPAGNRRRISSRSSETRDASCACRDPRSTSACICRCQRSPVYKDNRDVYANSEKAVHARADRTDHAQTSHRDAAMSRLRAQWPSGIPSDLMREYYSQRASDGGLILTEATAISPSGRGYRGAPCLYRDEQVTGWQRITDAVHANGGYMFVQLWHAGRTTHVAVTGEQPVTASVDPAYWADPNIFVVTPDGFSRPSPHRALETTEIAVIIEQYRTAAVNAKRAGFDGVEVMAAKGHLVDQVLQDNSNKRTAR